MSFDAVGRVLILVALGYFAAHIIEGALWIASAVGLPSYHVSVSLRTIGVVAVYMVFRSVITSLTTDGWRGLGRLLL